MWKYFSGKLLRNKLAFTLVVLLLTVFMGYEASRMELSYEFAKILPDNDTTFIEYVKKKYYNSRGELKEPINIPGFLDDYMKFYARTNGYYSGQDQILIFKKIFFKKLKLKSSEQPIPCFWLNYESVGHIKLSTKKIKFMKILRESLEEEDKNKNFISIIRDGEHFKLFLYRDQTIYVKSIYE